MCTMYVRITTRITVPTKRFSLITRIGALVAAAGALCGLVRLAVAQPSLHLQPLVTNPFTIILLASISIHLVMSGLDMWVRSREDSTKEQQLRNLIEHEVQVRTKELQEAR